MVANIIPNVPYQVDRQIALEKQLLARNNYESLEMGQDRKAQQNQAMDSYDQFLSEVRKAHDDDERGLDEVVNRNSWVRRISRRISSNSLTNSLDASTTTKSSFLSPSNDVEDTNHAPH